jgi:sulfatase maturation enzyme AslB (radical SAM superfamily)
MQRKRVDKYFYRKAKMSFSYSPSFYDILITSECNLRCKYCYEHNKHKNFVSIDNVKKFIDYIFE